MVFLFLFPKISPLCVEEFDIQDRNFRPCPCGYQVDYILNQLLYFYPAAESY